MGPESGSANEPLEYSSSVHCPDGPSRWEFLRGIYLFRRVDVRTEATCGICLGTSETDVNVWLNCCGAVMGVSCLETWLKTRCNDFAATNDTCPCCRKTICKAEPPFRSVHKEDGIDHAEDRSDDVSTKFTGTTPDGVEWMTVILREERFDATMASADAEYSFPNPFEVINSGPSSQIRHVQRNDAATQTTNQARRANVARNAAWTFVGSPRQQDNGHRGRLTESSGRMRRPPLQRRSSPGQVYRPLGPIRIASPREDARPIPTTHTDPAYDAYYGFPGDESDGTTAWDA